ncbi:hypothetical protein ACFLT1_01995, partial [Bacteroidota bacterium]
HTPDDLCTHILCRYRLLCYLKLLFYGRFLEVPAGVHEQWFNTTPGYSVISFDGFTMDSNTVSTNTLFDYAYQVTDTDEVGFPGYITMVSEDSCTFFVGNERSYGYPCIRTDSTLHIVTERNLLKGSYNGIPGGPYFFNHGGYAIKYYNAVKDEMTNLFIFDGSVPLDHVELAKGDTVFFSALTFVYESFKHE